MKIAFCSRECAEAFLKTQNEDILNNRGFIDLITFEIDYEALSWSGEDCLLFKNKAHYFNMGWMAARTY